ncbi:MAG: sodium-dependent transporter [Peptococcaceae bacterium]|nr:sodium-dependent transporter [Peptococcaceae bacterium]
MAKHYNPARDVFRSRFGFIMACIGSAVGMGNIWLFPYRVGEFGGFAFLVPFFIFELALGFCGVMGEMAFGRAMRTGPTGAFKKALARRGKRGGEVLGILPLVGALGIAIGYTVIVGWVLRFLWGALSGTMFGQEAGAYFGEISGPFGSIGWHIVAIVITFIIMNAGIAAGIERASKIIMPVFFLLFVGLAIFVSTIPGAESGYAFLFDPDWAALAKPETWVYALGQAFFSLSLAGSGTIVYGSYLREDTDIVFSGACVFIFDLIASILIALVIIPAVFAFGADPQSGPPLIFIVLPSIFAQAPQGQFLAIVFFVAVFFAGITSLVNLFECPIEALQERFEVKRHTACAIVLGLAFVVGIFLENAAVIGGWMDLFSIYIMPVGALLAGILFFWVCGKDFAAEEINRGSNFKVGATIAGLGRYVYCGVTILVLLLGILLGGIG